MSHSRAAPMGDHSTGDWRACIAQPARDHGCRCRCRLQSCGAAARSPGVVRCRTLPPQETAVESQLFVRPEALMCSYLEGWSSEEDSTLVGSYEPGACALERVCSLLESSGTDLSDGHLRTAVRLTAARGKQAPLWGSLRPSLLGMRCSPCKHTRLAPLPGRSRQPVTCSQSHPGPHDVRGKRIRCPSVFPPKRRRGPRDTCDRAVATRSVVGVVQVLQVTQQPSILRVTRCTSKVKLHSSVSCPGMCRRSATHAQAKLGTD